MQHERSESAREQRVALYKPINNYTYHGVIPVSVSAHRFSSWSCGASNCLGVGTEITHYDTSEDPYSSDGTRASDVIDVTLFNQETGRNEMHLTDV